MKILWPIFIATLLFGCGEHSQPHEAPLGGDTTNDETTVRLEELDSVARAAVIMMQNCFKLIDSSMKAGEPEEIKRVPVFDLHELDCLQTVRDSIANKH
ncbi:MAG: hypothetical protein GF344_11275 [Chitinivibrionales bacterium]|nr:hypothetical protein [Chitinivibrionales bacterium]MBD3357383.1 hypothetical protein [Chitinivibrionales bacterium]